MSFALPLGLVAGIVAADFDAGKLDDISVVAAICRRNEP